MVWNLPQAKSNVDFEMAEHLDWPVRKRENLGTMGYGPRFRQDRARGYASKYLLDKPLNAVGPQVRLWLCVLAGNEWPLL